MSKLSKALVTMRRDNIGELFQYAARTDNKRALTQLHEKQTIANNY